MALRDLTLDLWSWLNHKAALAEPGSMRQLVQTWVSEEHQRRIAAYPSDSRALRHHVGCLPP